MPAGIVPITKVSEQDDKDLESLPSNDLVSLTSKSCSFFLVASHSISYKVSYKITRVLLGIKNVEIYLL